MFLCGRISRFLTTLWVYKTLLRPAEWLLVIQSDSILCASSRQNLNDFLGYDWVGAPWNPDGRYGGNGGLSLRRVNAIDKFPTPCLPSRFIAWAG